MDLLRNASAYVGNTLQDDEKVAKQLVGHEPEVIVTSSCLRMLESALPAESQILLQHFQVRIFLPACGLNGSMAANTCQ